MMTQDPKTAIGILKELAFDHEVTNLANFVLDDPRFVVWSGAPKEHQHHYGKGGLAIHTLEVVQLCMQNNAYFFEHGAHETHLFLAALFHDAGKMYDYQPLVIKNDVSEEFVDYDNWESAVHKRRVHHVTRSALMWTQAKNEKFDPYKYKDPDDDVLHAILAHHGLRAWGSPVAPATKIAWLLHLCDGISARMNDCEKFDRFTS